jgi:hypothetical protein
MSLGPVAFGPVMRKSIMVGVGAHAYFMAVRKVGVDEVAISPSRACIQSPNFLL